MRSSQDTILVSVCIPAYNNARSFRRTLISVVQQTLAECEIVVTDDSSNSEVKEVVSEIADPRIRYYRNERRLGAPANWNRALTLARGKYIKIMHHDDSFSTNTALEELVSLMQGSAETMLGFCACLVEKDGEETPRGCGERELTRIKRSIYNLYPSNVIGGPSATIYRAQATPQLFDERIRWVVDMEFYIRVLEDGGKIAYVPRALVVTHEEKGRVTDSCVDNREVELFEWIYLFERLPMRYKLKNWLFVLRLMLRYEVRSTKDLRDVGLQPQPGLLTVVLLMSRLLTRIRFKRILAFVKGE
jgi:glycosyltransferase involved in cell wall biosynthesis